MVRFGRHHGEARMTRDEINSRILHRFDGPLTMFVLMCRTTEAVAAGADPTDAANALYEGLLSLGLISETEE